MTLNCRSSTRAYLIAVRVRPPTHPRTLWLSKTALELEQQFLVNKALLYVDAVYNYYDNTRECIVGPLSVSPLKHYFTRFISC
jgi:hypothetical protein